MVLVLELWGVLVLVMEWWWKHLVVGRWSDGSAFSIMQSDVSPEEAICNYAVLFKAIVKHESEKVKAHLSTAQLMYPAP